MTLHCRFSSCSWFGPENQILLHLKTCHKNNVREPNGKNYFDFNYVDLLQETFVLHSYEGLYWFRQNLHHRRSSGLTFGLFHIGKSKRIQYTLKLAPHRENYCEYWSPLPSEDENFQNPHEEKYGLDFGFFPNGKMISRRFRLYFDSDDKLFPEPQNMQWATKDKRVSRLAVEHFNCGVCFGNIRPGARFCQNDHFICLNCFNKMTLILKLKCPICRGHLHDCSSDLIFMWTDVDVCVIRSLNDFVKYFEFLETADVCRSKR